MKNFKKPDSVSESQTECRTSGESQCLALPAPANALILVVAVNKIEVKMLKNV